MQTKVGLEYNMIISALNLNLNTFETLFCYRWEHLCCHRNKEWH